MPWSRKQIGAFGSAYGAKKKGKSKPRKTPSSVWKMSVNELSKALHEGVKRKKKLRKK